MINPYVLKIKKQKQQKIYIYETEIEFPLCANFLELINFSLELFKELIKSDFLIRKLQI